MPELKNTFTGGKMEKDLDERIVPSGQYREALNISVATSEDSDVGAVQNILGNIKLTKAIQSRTMDMLDEYAGDNYHVAEVVDPLTDMLYRFVHTASTAQGIWMDRIVEFDTQTILNTPWDEKEHAVMVDIFKVTTTIDTHEVSLIDNLPCVDSNKCRISLLNRKNLNQIRWGMKVVGPDLADPKGLWSDSDVTVEDVDYENNWITLNKPIYSGVDGDGDGQNIIFYGDRNLSFGDKDNIKNITGINIIDGMIFWTDNFSEPKKVNIERGKQGSNSEENDRINRGVNKIDDFNQHTLLIVDNKLTESCVEDEWVCDSPYTIPDSWDCDGQGNCYDPGTGLGLYQNVATCQASCVGKSWNCNNGVCTDPGNGTGTYPSLTQCNTACAVAASWYCANGSCVDPGNGSGTYSSLSACQSACSITPSASWDCIGGTCIDPGNGTGQYTSLGACQAVCVVVSLPSWDCNPVDSTCSDPGTGNGAYSSLTACQTACGSCSVPDAEFEQYLISSGWDQNIDSLFNPTLYGAPASNPAETETEVDVSWPSSGVNKLNSLEGIECFRDLEVLYCNDNQILSGQTATWTFGSQTQVGYLPLTSNLELQQLECRNNRLKQLDISANTKLTHLDCSDNDITSLQNTTPGALFNVPGGIVFGNHPDLKILKASNNSDTWSMVYNTSTGAYNMSTSAVKLQFDFSNCPVLEEIDISKNNQRAAHPIGLTGSQSLLPNLKILNIDSTGISGVNLSNSTQLTRINAANCNFKNINFDSPGVSLTRVEMKNNPNIGAPPLVPGPVTTVVQSFVNNPNLEYLDIRNIRKHILQVGGVKINLNNGNTIGITHLKLYRNIPFGGHPLGHYIYVICDSSWIDTYGGVEKNTGSGLWTGYNATNPSGTWVGPPQWRINGDAGPPLPLPGPNGNYNSNNKTFFVRPTFTNFV